MIEFSISLTSFIYYSLISQIFYYSLANVLIDSKMLFQFRNVDE